MGWEVLFVDRLEPEMCVDEAGRPASLEESANLWYLLAVMEGFGFSEDFALAYDQGASFIGLSRREVLARTSRSAFLLNVMGFLTDEEILGAARRRVFLDTDPGFGQMWRDLGQADLFRGHDDFVTIAENIGRPRCAIPTCGLEWIPWRQPVLLDEWHPTDEAARSWFTSVGSWRGPYAPVEHRGRTYGLRAHEFRRFLELPRLTGLPFEVALEIHATEALDLERLASNGWSLADPRIVAADPWAYRDYIRRSRAEFTAAKGMYVASRSGWFSERSICYLASGKPVVAQDTGLAGIYPLGEGLLAFQTLEEARASVEDLAARYDRHSRAARELAAEYFDSDKVLGLLLHRLSI